MNSNSPPANSTPPIRLTAIQKSCQLPTFQMSLAAFRQVCCCLFACPRVFRCWGNPCLSILSGHCSRWLTRDNHVYFRGCCFLGRSCWARPFLNWSRCSALCCPIRLTFPSKHIWSRRRFLNVYTYLKQTSKTRLAFTGLLRATLLTENASLSDVFWFGRLAALLMGLQFM